MRARKILSLLVVRPSAKPTLVNRIQQVAVLVLGLSALPIVAVVSLAFRLRGRIVGYVFRPMGRLSLYVDACEFIADQCAICGRGDAVIGIPIGQVPNSALEAGYAEKIPLLRRRNLIVHQAIMLLPQAIVTRVAVSYPARPVLGFGALREQSIHRSSRSERLDELGISRRSFGIFALSEPQYYRHILGLRGEQYHRARNSDCSEFSPLSNFFQERGIVLVRVGLMGRPITETNLESVMVDNVPGRTDWNEMDIVRAAKFGWADSCGAWWLWAALERPALLSNCPSLRMRFAFPPTILYIPTLYEIVSEGRLMTFGEMLDGGGGVSRNLMFRGTKVRRVPNSTEDLRAGLLDLFASIDVQAGHSSPATCDTAELPRIRDALSQVFREKNHPPNLNIPASFLLRHSSLVVGA